MKGDKKDQGGGVQGEKRHSPPFLHSCLPARVAYGGYSPQEEESSTRSMRHVPLRRGPLLSTSSVAVPVNYSRWGSGPGERLWGCADRGKGCRTCKRTRVVSRGRCKGSGVKGLRNELMNPRVVTLRDLLVFQLAPGDSTLITQNAPSRFKAFLLCTIS